MDNYMKLFPNINQKVFELRKIKAGLEAKFATNQQPITNQKGKFVTLKNFHKSEKFKKKLSTLNIYDNSGGAYFGGINIKLEIMNYEFIFSIFLIKFQSAFKFF